MESGRLRIHIQTGAEIVGLSHWIVAAAPSVETAPGDLQPCHHSCANSGPSENLLEGTYSLLTFVVLCPIVNERGQLFQSTVTTTNRRIALS